MEINYKMIYTVVGTTIKANGIGIKISFYMNASCPCGITASKCNQIIGLIRRYIAYKYKELIIPLYKAIFS